MESRINRKTFWVITITVGVFFFLVYHAPAYDWKQTDRISKDAPHKLFLMDNQDTVRQKTKDISMGQLGISPSQIYSKILADTDRFLRTKKRTIDENSATAKKGGVARAFKDQVLSLAFVYKMTGDQKYLTRAKQLIRNIIKWKKWNHIYRDPGMNSLDRDAIVVGLSFAYNWLYEDLSHEERRRVAGAIVTKGVKPIYECLKNNKWPFSLPENNNHYIAGIAALGIGSLAVIQDESQAEKALDAAIKATRRFIEASGGKDGGYPESLLYGSFSLLNLLTFRDVLLQCKGVDLLEFDTRGWIKNFNRQILYSTFPDFSSVVLFNDQKPNLEAIAKQLLRASKLYNGTELGSHCQFFLKAFVRKDHTVLRPSPLTFLSYESQETSSDLRNLAKFKVFRDLGQAFYRSNWAKPDSLFVAVKAATHRENSFWSNVAHLHYDGGNFVVFKNGNEYITDLGYQVGAPWAKEKTSDVMKKLSKNSTGHSNLLFDGKPQDALEARIVNYFHEEGLFYVEMDLKNAYASLDLDRYTREFLIIDDTIFTIDTFKGSGIGRYNYRLPLTHRSKKGIKSNRPIVDGSAFRIMPYQGSEILFGRVLYPASVQVRVEDINFSIKGKRGTLRFIDEENPVFQGMNYLINVFSFSDEKIILQDKKNYFMIETNESTIHIAKETAKDTTMRMPSLPFTGKIQISDKTGRKVSIK